MRLNNLNIGDKVVIIEDCRSDKESATGKTATYEGDFPRVAIVKVAGEYVEFYYDRFVSGQVVAKDSRPLCDIVPFWQARENDISPIKNGPVIRFSRDDVEPIMFWFPNNNPRFRLDDGLEIWGDECWWTPVNEAPPLEQAQAELRIRKDAISKMIELLNDSIHLQKENNYQK